MTSFFEEVKRRKVYRVAVAYVIAAGGVIQLASAAFPAWELPNWALRLVIVLLLIGFPIALILAWAFDVTAAGIRSTPNAIAPRTHRRRNVIMLVATGVMVSAIAGFFLLPRVSSARKIDKSIAVLPFENLSDEKENAYFADGIQDDLLTNLSKIGDLKVISRTSVMPYRGKEANVREIGKALGVATILEGSVRRIGNRVRVNVQLINTENDQHIWAEDYDRDLTDVFAIQTDLAQKIAAELRAKLSPTEKAQMERPPTENGEAYLAFVQAHNLQGAFGDFDKLKHSEQLYERAIQLDSKFALALARYSQLESWIARSYDRTRERREKARSLADRALQLQPDLPEGHLALGFSYYYGDNNYEAALGEFQAAQRGLPNEFDAYLAIGAIERRQGKWAESTANLEKAATLSPNDSWVLQNLAFNYSMHRNFDAANKTIDRALQLKPEGLSLWEIKAKLAVSEKGDLSVGEKLLERAKSIPMSKEEKLTLLGGQVNFLLLQRKYKEVLEIAQNSSDDLFAVVPGSLAQKYFAIGLAQKGLHDETSARAALLKAKNICEEQLKQKPDDPELYVHLAKLNAWLGDKDAALSEAQRATQLRPESKDTFEGPRVTEGVAEVHAILGDNDRAIELLDGLLNRPSDLTVATLKLNPVWDPLRNDPRFQALLTKYGDKT
jgi:TolB-like protein/Flp pilus assembly protein TadD